MSFRKFFLLCAAAILALSSGVAAQAQAGVYATITGEHINSITCGDPQGRCASTDGTARPYGTTFGAQYDWRSFGPVLFGFDARGEILNSNKSAAYYLGGADAVRQYSALGGVRGTFKTRYKVLRPYVEVAGGLARTNATYVVPDANNSAVEEYLNFTQVQGLAGLDLALFPVLDLRAIEFGAGAIFGPSTHSTQSIGLGIVFHMPR